MSDSKSGGVRCMFVVIPRQVRDDSHGTRVRHMRSVPKSPPAGLCEPFPGSPAAERSRRGDNMHRDLPRTLRARSNGIELAYDSFGDDDPKAQPLLLIMGLGTQMIAWDEAFCEQLAANGYRVIRFDNRDIGESTRLDHAGVPEVGRLLMQAVAGLPVDAGAVPYTLADMAADAVGLLDALGIASAHVVGASMGG